MILKEKQVEELKVIAKPLIKFLNDNCHPHVIVVVDGQGCEIFEGLAKFTTNEYIKD